MYSYLLVWLVVLLKVLLLLAQRALQPLLLGDLGLVEPLVAAHGWTVRHLPAQFASRSLIGHARELHLWTEKQVPFKVPCAPKWFDFEFPIIKTISFPPARSSATRASFTCQKRNRSHTQHLWKEQIRHPHKHTTRTTSSTCKKSRHVTHTNTQ